jgi:hypothetical protein
MSNSVMKDIGFNVAVVKLAETLFPRGWDIKPVGQGPNTWQEALDYFNTHGCMCVTPAPTDEPVFANEYAYQAFRAWHDWVHITCGCQFTDNGENEAAVIQETQLACMYGRTAAKRWLDLLQIELVDTNHYTRHNVTVE